MNIRKFLPFLCKKFFCHNKKKIYPGNNAVDDDPIFDYILYRDPHTGIFGLDVLFTEYLLILWTVPGLPAHTAGLYPRDIIIAIDDILVEPNAKWPIDYISKYDDIKLTIIPAKVIFNNPILKWTLVQHTCKYGSICSRTRQFVQSLPMNSKGTKIDPIISCNYEQPTPPLMQDHVYI